MSAEHVFGAMAFAAMVGVILYRWAVSERRKTLRRLSGTPRTLAGEIKGGAVRVTGRVRASGRLCAPLSGRECVAFEMRIET